MTFADYIKRGWDAAQLKTDSIRRLADDNDIPLIIDNAYGTPFPHIIFTDAKPCFNEHTIVCMSLSKLGLPAARTGIVIAHESIVEALSATNAIIGLAPGGLLLMIAVLLPGRRPAPAAEKESRGLPSRSRPVPRVFGPSHRSRAPGNTPFDRRTGSLLSCALLYRRPASRQSLLYGPAAEYG